MSGIIGTGMSRFVLYREVFISYSECPLSEFPQFYLPLYEGQNGWLKNCSL